MKKLIYTLLVASAAITATGCAKQSGYTLTGQMPEAWDGKPVILMLNDANKVERIDSTEISGGEFRFQGEFDVPRRAQVVVFLDPENRQDPDLIVVFPVFLDSTAVVAVCDNSGAKPRFTLSGGATQAQYDQYIAHEEVLRADRKVAFRTYTNAFYKEKDIAKAIELVAIVDQKANLIRENQMQFIRQNPTSAVSLHILKGMCDDHSPLSRELMQELFASLTPALQQSEPGQSLQRTIEQRQIILGNPYPDLELQDRTGKKVKLSEVIKPGRYTLIELWASWCHPCRSEIPFIKRAYKEYHAKGFDVVGISVDQSDADWKKALAYEDMPWLQLLDDQRLSFPAYETSSVPTSILVDPQGRMCDLNARGGWLDKTLHEIYSK